jgi:hypothetical protein
VNAIDMPRMRRVDCLNPEHGIGSGLSLKEPAEDP